jgi:hypothetical protein
MPKYTINGQTIRTDKELTDAEIDEIAADLGGSTARQPAAGPVIGSEAAYQIPLQSVQAPAAQAPSPSSFRQGVLDPFRGGSQLVAEGLGTLGSEWGKSEAQRMQESINANEAAYQAQRKAAGETGMDVGRLAGNIVSPANLLALPAKGATKIASLLKAGIVPGLLEPSVEQGDGESFGERKATQAGTSLIGAVVGGAAAKKVGEALNPLVSKAEQTMRDIGVQLTPGQLMGGQAKALEEFAANMPLVGSYISNARERTLFSFNKGVINKALGKVGSKLDDEVIGRDAVQAANSIIDDKYDEVLSKMGFKLDFNTYTAMSKAVKMPSSVQARTQVKDILDSTVYASLPKSGAIDGQLYKNIESDLRKKAVSYSNSQMASEREIGDALFDALDAMKEGLRKQNPKYTSELRRVDSAYGDLAVMKQAAANTGAVNGVFTPKQYSSAVRQRDTTRSKSKFAAGLARGQDVSDAALQVLEKDAASTLEGRLAMQTTGTWGLLQNPVAASTFAVAAPIMYSESGLKAINTIMRSRPEVAKKIGKILTDRALKEGSITGAQVIEEYQRSLRTEE